MNSKKLKELHPEVYKKFFTENEVVLSMPLNMDWSLTTFGFGHYQGIHSKQKIPLRIYIGISHTDHNNDINFDVVQNYNIELDLFDTNDFNFNNFHKSSFFGKLSTYILEQIGNSPKGLIIRILSETSPKMDLGYFGVVTLLSILASHYINGNISFDDIQKACVGNIDETYFNSNFAMIFKDALTFSKVTSGYLPYLSIITGFFSGSYQFVGYRDKIMDDDLLDKRLKFFGIKTDDLCTLNNGYATNLSEYGASFDLALIYTGVPIQSNKHNLTNHYSNNIKDLKDDILDKYGEYKVLVDQTQFGFDDFFSQPIPDMDGIFSRLAESINLEIRYSLLSLATNRFHAHALDNLIAAVNKVLPLFTVFCSYGKDYLQVMCYLNGFLSNGNTGIGIMPFDIVSSGGVAAIISPLESCRKKVYNVVEQYRAQNTDSHMNIIYENWNDGYEYDGILVQQDIRIGIFSDLIERGNCVIQHHDGSTQLLEYSQIPLLDYDDIIIDTIYRKIYIPGQKLTSKDIHSQSSTSEILEIALQNLDTDIPNSKLPPSAYAKNKNDMTAKIVIPLKKLVEKYCDKDLLFSCSGSLSSFTIRLSSGKVKFGIVKKIS